jgi:hypothetical protein
MVTFFPSFGPSQGKASCMVAVALCPKPGWKVSISVGIILLICLFFGHFQLRQKIFYL